MSINTSGRAMNRRSAQAMEARAEGLATSAPRRSRLLGAAWRRSVMMAATALLVFAFSSAQAQTNDDQSRTSSFTYCEAGDGVPNGLLKTETVEPGNAQLCVTTIYTCDRYGNQASASTADCDGTAGNALFTSRASNPALGSQAVTVAPVSGVVVAAGAFATSNTNALGQSESRTYDPRFGIATSLPGPNGLTTNWTLDDFGRAVMESRTNGTRTVSDHSLEHTGTPPPMSPAILSAILQLLLDE